MGIFQTINCWKVDNLHQPKGLKLKRKIHFPKNSNLQFKRLHDSIVNWDSQFANFPNGHTDVQARIRKKRRAKFSLILFTEQRYVGRELTKQKFESFIPMYLTFNFEETEGLTIQILTVGIHCIFLCTVPNASWQWVCFWLVVPWRFCLQLFRVIWLFAFYWERTTNRAFWFCFSSLI